MYSLEYKMMLQVLRQLRSSGEFQAEIPPQAALRDGGHVLLRVQDGNVTSCFILNRNGKKMYHDAEAQRWLLRLGVLEWQLVSSTPPKAASSNALIVAPVSQPLPRSVSQPLQREEDLCPQRRMVSPTHMRSWSMLERSVYHLIDGTRTIEQIAKLLSRPTKSVEQVIHHFESTGVVELHRR